MSESRRIRGLGVPYAESYVNKAKSVCKSFLGMLSSIVPLPYSKIFSALSQRVRYKSSFSLKGKDVQHLVEFLQKGLSEGENFVLYSDEPIAEPLIRQLRSSSVGTKLWAHYCERHREYTPFKRAPRWLRFYDAIFAPVKYLVLLSHPSTYEERIRELYYNGSTNWEIILPHYEGEYSFSEWENPAPTLVWGMQFAGSERLRQSFEYLAKKFRRTEIPFGPPISPKGWYLYSARKMKNNQRHQSADCSLMKKHISHSSLHYHPSHPEEREQQLVLTLNALPYCSWTYVHEFIDFSKIQIPDDMQGVCIIRDPRDMLLSYFFRYPFDPRNYAEEHYDMYHRDIMKELIEKYDENTFKEEALLVLIDGGAFTRTPSNCMIWPSIREIAKSFVAAQRSTNVYSPTLEYLRASPEQGVKDLLEFLQWNNRVHVSEKEIAEAAHAGSLAFQTKGKVIEAGEHSNKLSYNSKTGEPISQRTGKAGGWQQHFSPRVIAKVKEEIGEELIELGYEVDQNW